MKLKGPDETNLARLSRTADFRLRPDESDNKSLRAYTFSESKPPAQTDCPRAHDNKDIGGLRVREEARERVTDLFANLLSILHLGFSGRYAKQNRAL